MTKFIYPLMLVLILIGWGQVKAENLSNPLPTTPPTAQPAAALPATTLPALNLSAPPTVIPSPAATATPTHDTSKDLHLGGRFGVGLGFLDSHTAAITGLSIRNWLTDDICMDVVGYYSDYTNEGQAFNGNGVEFPVELYGGGIGFKINLGQPVKNLFIQLQLQGSYFYNYIQSGDTLDFTTTTTETWAGFGGFCVEYFFPFLNSLSVESSIGYLQGFDNINETIIYGPSWYPPNTPNAVLNSSGTDGHLITNGLTLGGVYLHYYF